MPPAINPVYKVEIEDSLESPSARLFYLVTNTEDELTAYALVQTVLQPSYFGFYLTRFTLSHAGAGTWDVVVTYAGTVPQTDGTTTYELDFTGGTEKRRQSLGTQSFSGGDPTMIPNFMGAINVHDGQVEGVEVIVPKLMVTVTKYYSVQTLLAQQMQAIKNLEGHLNQRTFTLLLNNGQTLQAAPGEALFHGAPVKQKGSESWAFSWKFSMGATETVSITFVGNPVAQTFQKLPFSYLWVVYQPAVSNGLLVRQPLYAYLEKVYPDGDFSTLGV